MSRKPVKALYDIETGERTGELYAGDRITRAKSVDYLKSTMEMPEYDYVKMYLKPIAQLSGSLTGPECALTMFLVSFLSYDSGIAMHPNGRIVTRQYIAQEMGYSERQVDRLLDGLKEKEIIKKVLGAKREISIIMNPWLFMRGKRINKTLYGMFKNSRWAKIAELKRGEKDANKQNNHREK